MTLKMLMIVNQKFQGLFITVFIGGIFAIAVSSNNKYIASTSQDRAIKIFSLEEKKKIHSFKDPHDGSPTITHTLIYKFSIDGVSAVVVSSDNKYLISSSCDKSIKIFDLALKCQIYEFLDIHESTVLSC